jgi:cytoskeletal protein CcmA (bactofilin family)
MTFWNEKKDGVTGNTAPSNPATRKPNVSSETVVAELGSDLVKRWGTVQSALSAGSKVEGKLTFDRPVRIDGELKGEVKAKDALILIGPEAKVNAALEVAYLVVMGEFTGSVKASEKIDLMAGGTITGDIDTPRLTVQDGGEFNGSCTMRSANPAVKKPVSGVTSKDAVSSNSKSASTNGSAQAARA